MTWGSLSEQRGGVNDILPGSFASRAKELSLWALHHSSLSVFCGNNRGTIGRKKEEEDLLFANRICVGGEVLKQSQRDKVCVCSLSQQSLCVTF